ncbi:hypothetical protein TeGR_g5461 [Tetraparma gracilis]|uniref:Uncharacterized protein n=1 Tax=Tetraparma gracilis TaxID=2962635 RepID=A0ABQ6MGN6_9STRA|nr:hypothetical protein TeGR_g5461 [Tetraparma gracilis]
MGGSRSPSASRTTEKALLVAVSVTFLRQLGEDDTSPLVWFSLATVLSALYLHLNFSPSPSSKLPPSTRSSSSKPPSSLKTPSTPPYLNEGWVDDPSCPTMLHSDHKFIEVKFDKSEDLDVDMLFAQSRAKIQMEDDTVEGVLNDVGVVLEMANQNHTHMFAIYDLRKFCLPGPRGAFARARQLVAWCDNYEHLIDKHIAGVVVLIPRGMTAKLLKSCVDFVYAPPPERGEREKELAAAQRGGANNSASKACSKRS